MFVRGRDASKGGCDISNGGRDASKTDRSLPKAGRDISKAGRAVSKTGCDASKGGRAASKVGRDEPNPPANVDFLRRGKIEREISRQSRAKSPRYRAETRIVAPRYAMSSPTATRIIAASIALPNRARDGAANHQRGREKTEENHIFANGC